MKRLLSLFVLMYCSSIRAAKPGPCQPTLHHAAHISETPEPGNTPHAARPDRTTDCTDKPGR